MQIEERVKTKLVSQLGRERKKFSEHKRNIDRTVEKIEKQSLEKAEKIKGKSLAGDLLKKCQDALTSFPQKLRLNFPSIDIIKPISNFIDAANSESLNLDALDELFTKIEKAANKIDKDFEQFKENLVTIKEDLLEPFAGLAELKEDISQFANQSIEDLRDRIEKLLEFNTGPFNKTLDKLDGTLSEISEE